MGSVKSFQSCLLSCLGLRLSFSVMIHWQLSTFLQQKPLQTGAQTVTFNSGLGWCYLAQVFLSCFLVQCWGSAQPGALGWMSNISTFLSLMIAAGAWCGKEGLCAEHGGSGAAVLVGFGNKAEHAQTVPLPSFRTEILSCFAVGPLDVFPSALALPGFFFFTSCIVSNTSGKSKKSVLFCGDFFDFFFSLNRTRLVEQLESNLILWEF